jgi:hypothetical protein
MGAKTNISGKSKFSRNICFTEFIKKAALGIAS